MDLRVNQSPLNLCLRSSNLYLRTLYHRYWWLFTYEYSKYHYVWYYLPTPSDRAGYDIRSIFKRSLTGLNSGFSFSQSSCLTKAEEPSPSYYLPIAGGRISGFIPSPRILVLCEMQSVSSRIWTRIAVFISYGDNDYTTGTSKNTIMYGTGPLP